MTLGNKIKQLREAKKYSQEELADLLRVHAVTISKWENGIQEPRAKRLNELAKILGVSNEYLLEDKNENDVNNEMLGKMENGKTATISLGGDKNVTAPATPEGYAFLEKVLMIAMNAQNNKASLAGATVIGARG